MPEVYALCCTVLQDLRIGVGDRGGWGGRGALTSLPLGSPETLSLVPSPFPFAAAPLAVCHGTTKTSTSHKRARNVFIFLPLSEHERRCVWFVTTDYGGRTNDAQQRFITTTTTPASTTTHNRRRDKLSLSVCLLSLDAGSTLRHTHTHKTKPWP